MKNSIKIGTRQIGENQPCYLIAEIGINHNGDIAIAKRLIDNAVRFGFDAVKFQKRTIEVVYSAEELGRPRESPFGTTNGELKRGLEFGTSEFEEIDRYCKEKNIQWFCSAWDVLRVTRSPPLALQTTIYSNMSKRPIGQSFCRQA
jgi:N-acetylneuraminate synthase